MMRSASFLLGAIGLCAAVACSASGNSGGNGGGANAGGSSATGNGGNGGSGAIGLGGSGNSSATGGSGGGQVCDADAYTGVLLPLDMYVMLDRSGSMGDNGAWSGVTNAFQSFVSLPGLDGLGMGIAFFPIPLEPPPPPFCDANGLCGPNGICFGGICIPNDKCEPTDYAVPVVPIAPLPGVGPSINQAIAATGPEGNTPTRPALQGAMMYAIDWAKKNPDHITAVVLATDGEPTGCDPNSIADVSAAAALGFNSNPSVRTFVVGIGNLASLNAVAQAGGTNQAIIISTGNAAQDFLDALNAIRGAIGCSYKIPVPNNSEADPSKVNVAFTPDGGTKEYFPKVNGASDCQGQKGWYYDDNTNPTKIVLCPASCDVVTNNKGKVDVELGCEQIVK